MKWLTDNASDLLALLSAVLVALLAAWFADGGWRSRQVTRAKEEVELLEALQKQEDRPKQTGVENTLSSRVEADIRKNVERYLDHGERVAWGIVVMGLAIAGVLLAILIVAENAGVWGSGVKAVLGAIAAFMCVVVFWAGVYIFWIRYNAGRTNAGHRH